MRCTAGRREDPKWLQYKWTVYRGVAYDLTSFIDRHPAGSWLINLAIGRDCTALFESYHLRPEGGGGGGGAGGGGGGGGGGRGGGGAGGGGKRTKTCSLLLPSRPHPLPPSNTRPPPNPLTPYPHPKPKVAVARLRRLPVLGGFPVAAVPPSPRPNDSPVYNAIRERVRAEVFKGDDVKGAHRSGSEGAAVAIVGYAAAAYALFAAAPGPLTGFLLGLGGAWIGLTVQVRGGARRGAARWGFSLGGARDLGERGSAAAAAPPHPEPSPLPTPSRSSSTAATTAPCRRALWSTGCWGR
jgi:hypothetical protein